MKQYGSKKAERFYIGHFYERSEKKIALSEWHLYEESKKIFVNIRIAKEQGLRQAVKDGVQLYFYPDKEGEIFVNVDWLIERNVMGSKNSEYLQEVKLKILENDTKLIEDYMDKQINKVKKDVEKGEKKKAEKDISKLLKMDKKFDKKIDKCEHMEKSKKK
jgi:hypothetical protein